MPSDFLRVGNMAYNLAHVRQIFKEEEVVDPATGLPSNPDTWSVLYEMGIQPSTGLGMIQCQVFTGEEGKAIEFWVTNNIPDVREQYRIASAPRAKKIDAEADIFGRTGRTRDAH